ncbi:30S ribosome-binding factor RbfA [Nakamurella lactea]|uniref:30S ribosome-binding factor RbfA n=1 Tax=Nakamurella lactea TaxID=459515 RepID=UPI00040CBEFB|nr:30S ribosome-binding factor RbfA [Nakamurella lactea]
MADSARARRLAKRIAAIVATELEHQVKDPRLAMITVTAATVTPDLREATVYYTVYGDDEELQSTEAALASATGVLRSAVGKQTGIKFTPTLAFKLDRVPDTSKHIEALLAAAKAADAAIAQQAADKAYAGDADPYRVPREDIEGLDELDADEDTADDDATDADADAADADAADADAADADATDEDATDEDATDEDAAGVDVNEEAARR